MKGICKVIGCRAGSPLDGTPASGYLLKFPDGNILIDCGPGVMLNLNEQEIEDLMAVIITHKHADHMLDLMSMAYNLVFPVQKRSIPLYAPESVFSTLKEYDKVFGIPTLDMLREPIGLAFKEFTVRPGESFTIGDHHFDTLPMKHPVETMAIKSADLQLVYTADGAYTEKLYDFILGTNVLIAEATYPDAEGHDLESHGHMTAQQGGSLAQNSAIRHLIVTHISDPKNCDITMDIVQNYFSGISTLAYPGLEIECAKYIRKEYTRAVNNE